MVTKKPEILLESNEFNENYYVEDVMIKRKQKPSPLSQESVHLAMKAITYSYPSEFQVSVHSQSVQAWGFCLGDRDSSWEGSLE